MFAVVTIYIFVTDILSASAKIHLDNNTSSNPAGAANRGIGLFFTNIICNSPMEISVYIVPGASFLTCFVPACSGRYEETVVTCSQ